MRRRAVAAVDEEFAARLFAQRLLLSLPLLRRNGTLALLGIDAAPPRPVAGTPDSEAVAAAAPGAIDATAADAITGLGGSDFL